MQPLMSADCPAVCRYCPCVQCILDAVVVIVDESGGGVDDWCVDLVTVI